MPTPTSTSLQSHVTTNLAFLEKHNPYQNVIKTGYWEFDRSFGGLVIGEVEVVSAICSMGKTSLLINMSLNMSQHVPVLFMAFNDSSLMLTTRFLTTLSGVASKKIRQNTLNEQEKAALKVAQENLEKYQLFITDTYYSTPQLFEKECIAYIQHHGVKVIIVDDLVLHLQRNPKKIKQFLVCMQQLATAHQITFVVSWVMLYSKLLPHCEKYPQFTALPHWDLVQNHCNKAIFLHRFEYFGITEDEAGACTKGIMQLMVAKNKYGSLDSLILRCNDDISTISNEASVYATIPDTLAPL